MAASSEDAVPEPAAGRTALLVDPEPRAPPIAGNVVIACHVLAIPPAGFDALGPALDGERPAIARRPARFFESRGLRQHPQRTHRRGSDDLLQRAAACLGVELRHAPGGLRTMLRHETDAEP